MSKWSLDFTPEAKSDLNKFDEELQRRIIDKIERLQANFNNMIPSALGGDWAGYFKLRVGDWRVIYKADWAETKIIVCIIDHRGKIYKRHKARGGK